MSKISKLGLRVSLCAIPFEVLAATGEKMGRPTCHCQQSADRSYGWSTVCTIFGFMHLSNNF